MLCSIALPAMDFDDESDSEWSYACLHAAAQRNDVKLTLLANTVLYDFHS